MGTRAKSSVFDDMVAALMDPRIKDVLTQVIHPLMMDTMSKFVAESLKPISATLGALVVDNTKMVATTEHLASENQRLDVANKKLLKQVDELSAYTRRDNILIQGLPIDSYADAAATQSSASRAAAPALGPSNESTMNAVIQLFGNSLGIQIDKSEISVAHRLSVSTRFNSSSSLSTSPPPVIVKFVRRQTR